MRQARAAAARPPYQDMCVLLDSALTLPLWPQSQPAHVEGEEEITVTAMRQVRAAAYTG